MDDKPLKTSPKFKKKLKNVKQIQIQPQNLIDKPIDEFSLSSINE